MKRTISVGASLVVLAMAASGCTSLRSALGIDKNAPDEFTVVSRAPLTLPPDYNLRPPQEVGGKPATPNPTEQARQTVFRVADPRASGPNPTANPNLTPGEAALLTKAGAGTADPKIRQTVNEETSRLLERDHSFIDSLLFWKSTPQPGENEVVDAAKEAQRLNQNAAVGKPASDGDTPTIQRRSHSLLEGVF